MLKCNCLKNIDTKHMEGIIKVFTSRIIKFITLLPLLLFMGVTSCGKTSVSIDSRTYEPKIVIAGLIYPDQSVTNIKITRNFPVGVQIDLNKIDLSNATVLLTDLQSGEKYQLTYNYRIGAFEYPRSGLKIKYDNSYKLDVSASFDDYALKASAVTTVPGKGLEIIADSSIIGRLYYRQKDEQGNLVSPTLVYRKSKNAAFYLASITAFYASPENFIYENPPGFDINKALEHGANIQDFQFTSTWDKRFDSGGALAKMEINWFNFWFYTQYGIILYAADVNYYHYFLTHEFVQEVDGNLHEPIFDIEGDGIGYFGSAVTDTVYLQVLKK